MPYNRGSQPNQSHQPNPSPQPNPVVQAAAHACIQAQTALIPLIQKLNPSQKASAALAQQINAQLETLSTNFYKITSHESPSRNQPQHPQGWTPSQTEAATAAFDALNALSRNLDKNSEVSLSTLTHIYYLMGAFFGLTASLVTSLPSNTYLTPSRHDKRKVA